MKRAYTASVLKTIVLVVMNVSAADSIVYRDVSGRFEFTLAPGWRSAEAGPSGAAMFEGPDGQIGVTFEESKPGKWTVATLMKAQQVALETELPGWRIGGTAELESAGMPGRLVSYIPPEGDEGVPRAVAGCIVFPEGGVGFAGFVHTDASVEKIAQMLRTVRAPSGHTKP